MVTNNTTVLAAVADQKRSSACNRKEDQLRWQKLLTHVGYLYVSMYILVFLSLPVCLLATETNLVITGAY